MLSHDPSQIGLPTFRVVVKSMHINGAYLWTPYTSQPCNGEMLKSDSRLSLALSSRDITIKVWISYIPYHVMSPITNNRPTKVCLISTGYKSVHINGAFLWTPCTSIPTTKFRDRISRLSLAASSRDTAIIWISSIPYYVSRNASWFLAPFPYQVEVG